VQIQRYLKTITLFLGCFIELVKTFIHASAKWIDLGLEIEVAVK